MSSEQVFCAYRSRSAWPLRTRTFHAKCSTVWMHTRTNQTLHPKGKKVKVKEWYLLLTWGGLRPKALYNLGSSSWLAWANDTASKLCSHPYGCPRAASRHTTAPISHSTSSTRSHYSFPISRRVGGWVDLSTQYVKGCLQMTRGENRTVT